MNIVPLHGRSYKYKYCFWPHDFRLYDETCPPEKLAQFFIAYRSGSVDEWLGLQSYGKVEFLRKTQKREIIHFEIVDTSSGEDVVKCRLGIECYDDKKGPYLSLLYCIGEEFQAYWRLVVKLLLILAAQFCELKEPRLLLIGRPGWKRWLKARGIRRDDDGMISGWQEVFHGW